MIRTSRSHSSPDRVLGHATRDEGAGPSSLVPRTSTFRIALFAGEYSGDVQGAALSGALRERWSEAAGGELTLCGIGGRRMCEAGVELWFDSTHWGAMGTYEALKLAPRLLWVLSRVKKALREAPPDLLVVIDFGAFNARLAAWAKRQGIRVFYYFPPGSWRRGPIRPGPRSLPEIADRIATPFPWSEIALRQAGADAHFVGHPLLDLVRPTMSPDEFRHLHGIAAATPLVCHLPGSRRHELRYNWPAMRGAADLLSRKVPGLSHVLALAPSVSDSSYTQFEGTRRGQAAQATVVRLREPATVYDALMACDVAITKSGTVTLEAAILERPMVILYRGSWIQEIEYQLLHRRRIGYIGMPNIILDRQAFPELIQHAASSEGIAEAALPLLVDPAARERAMRDLRAVRTVLGEPGGVGRTADLILELCRAS